MFCVKDYEKCCIMRCVVTYIQINRCIIGSCYLHLKIEEAEASDTFPFNSIHKAFRPEKL